MVDGKWEAGGGCECQWLGGCELSEFKAKPMHSVDVDADDAENNNIGLSARGTCTRGELTLHS